MVKAIAAEYETMERELLRVNNMSDPKRLLAYQVLHVPLRGGVLSVFFWILSSVFLLFFYLFEWVSIQ